jgi:hypothetical protein
MILAGPITTGDEMPENIRPTKGTRGFLLYSPATKGFFFRVYDPEDKSKFVDYDLHFEDLEVEIVDNFTCFYEGERNRIDYSPAVLGKKV